MLHLTALFLLTFFLYFGLKKLLNKNLLLKEDKLKRLKVHCENSIRESACLKESNSALENSAEEIIALYDITKDICTSLEVEEVFNIFCESLPEHVNVGECKLVMSEQDLKKYKDYTVLPLKIQNEKIGYLLAQSIRGQDKDKFHILAQQFLLGIKRAILYQRIQELAITDSLTQVFSRRHFLERYEEELNRSKKFNYNLSFLMVDIDHFKSFNDRYGHLVGDVILREISKAIKDNIRQIDFVGRYGGEEFSIVLTETDKENAAFIAQRIRLAIEQKLINAYDEDLKVTVSIGISAFPADTSDIKALIDRSDKALYQAKENGRNRVCVYNTP